MRAMLLREYGEQARFELADLPKPELKPGHALVRIQAVSVNTVDTMIRRLGTEGLPFSPPLPAVLGMDFAGTVEAVGEGVETFAEGDEVFGCAGGLADLPGALADYMVADVRLLAHKPQSLGMREAAALPLVGITAYEGLQRAQVRPGQKVLVHGGAGGVGHVAIQLARHFGADVFATGSGAHQLSVIRELGAVAIDHRQQTPADYVAEHTHGAGFEVVYDSVGGENLLNSFEAATLNGSVATTVSLLSLDLSLAHFKGLSVHVVFMLIPMIHDMHREAHGQILKAMAEIADAGALKPVLDPPSYGLEQAGEAYDRLETRKATGKVVIGL